MICILKNIDFANIFILQVWSVFMIKRNKEICVRMRRERFKCNDFFFKLNESRSFSRKRDNVVHDDLCMCLYVKIYVECISKNLI